MLDPDDGDPFPARLVDEAGDVRDDRVALVSRPDDAFLDVDDRSAVVGGSRVWSFVSLAHSRLVFPPKLEQLGLGAPGEAQHHPQQPGHRGDAENQHPAARQRQDGAEVEDQLAQRRRGDCDQDHLQRPAES